LTPAARAARDRTPFKNHVFFSHTQTHESYQHTQRVRASSPRLTAARKRPARSAAPTRRSRAAPPRRPPVPLRRPPGQQRMLRRRRRPRHSRRRPPLPQPQRPAASRRSRPPRRSCGGAWAAFPAAAQAARLPRLAPARAHECSCVPPPAQVRITIKSNALSRALVKPTTR
jgi:hypothetical protein